MYGTFTGKNVEVYIVLTPISKKVKSVIVFYPKDNSWSSIKYAYFKLKDSFKKKYPLEKEFELFSDPYYEGDGYEMQAVRNDKCFYTSFFQPDLGKIMLHISKYEQLQVVYEDSINARIGSEEKESKVMDDI